MVESPQGFFENAIWGRRAHPGLRTPLQIGSAMPDAILTDVFSTLRHLGSNLEPQCTGSSPFFARGLHEDEATVLAAADDQHVARHNPTPQTFGALIDAQGVRLKSRRGSSTFRTKLAKFDEKLPDWLILTSKTQRTAQHFKGGNRDTHAAATTPASTSSGVAITPQLPPPSSELEWQRPPVHSQVPPYFPIYIYICIYIYISSNQSYSYVSIHTFNYIYIYIFICDSTYTYIYSSHTRWYC